MSRENFLIVLQGTDGKIERVNPSHITRISTTPATDKAHETTTIYFGSDKVVVKETAVEICKKAKTYGVVTELA